MGVPLDSLEMGIQHLTDCHLALLGDVDQPAHVSNEEILPARLHRLVDQGMRRVELLSKERHHAPDAVQRDVVIATDRSEHMGFAEIEEGKGGGRKRMDPNDRLGQLQTGFRGARTARYPGSQRGAGKKKVVRHLHHVVGG